MKMKIAILGSTGSIGVSTLEVVKKDKKNFDVILLTANNNYKKLIQQAKEFKARNVLIRNHKFYLKVKNSLKKTKVYSGDISLKKIFSKKLDYTMSAVVGLAGLQPTIDAIKISKTVAIANKETIRLIFGLKLRQLRNDKKFSLAELSKKTGVSQSYLNEIEKGKKYPKTDKIILLSSALGVPYDKMVSLKLSKNLSPIAELLDSNILNELPLDLFGFEMSKVIELISNAPACSP